MKILTALFMSGSLLCLALPMAHAEEKPLPPVLPQGYDLMTLSRGPAKEIPGLETRKNESDTANILTVGPAAGNGAGTRIEWSGYVSTGVVYKNTRNR